MTQLDPCTLYATMVVLGFVVYVIAIILVYRKHCGELKPVTIVETKEKLEAPQLSINPKKTIRSSEDPNSAILLREINEKLSNIDAIAKFTKTRSIADRLAESQEKTDEIDPVRAKITNTLRAKPYGESKQSEESKPETIAERTEELA